MNKTKITIVSIFSIIFGLIGMNTVLAAGPAAINLGTAGNFEILAKTGISTTGTTSVVGDIGVSPAEATYITGFGLSLPADGAYSTSSLVTGKVYAPSYAVPTPANISTAVSDMETAYNDGAGRSQSVITELGAGNIGGMTLAPGLYKWGTGVTIPTDVTLAGSANDVWIFVIAQNLDISSAKSIILSGGAKANNIYWVVAGQTTIGTGAVFNGNILDQTAIVLNTGATLNGRALAQSAVTLDASVVTLPSGSSSVTTVTPTVPATSSNNSTGNNSNSNSNSSTTTSATTTSANTNNSEIAPGCSNGNIFNTSTGTRCTNNSEVAPGCSNGNIFNTSTGARCTNYIAQASQYNFGTTTLKQGSTGESVMELQRFLNAKLNLGLVIDGKLGPKTIAVIKQWQKDNGLVSDGLVGAKTKLKMNSMVQ